jgi:co-chaperonin GroES (HSP10)
MTISPIQNKVIFKFLQETHRNGFINVTKSGIIVQAPFDDPKTPRWGSVIKVGEDVKKVKAGDYILIEPLMWTEFFIDDDGGKSWSTDETKIMAKNDVAPDGIA